jgi:energy-coupling factor transporter ATP-binding protein EcfA2
MIDFLMISTRSTKRGVIEIYPKFVIKKSTDLMIRGGDFYAIWIEERGLWSTDEHDALQLIDRELDRYVEENRQKFDSSIKVLYMWDAESGMIDSWHKYCQKQMRDNFYMLDEKLIFSNYKTNKKDYASKKLGYPLEAGDLSAYDKLISTLYVEEERHKIEWAIGSIVSGDSKRLQKFMVLYGATGTGKSTILNIIQQLFEGYYSVFDARALGSSSNSFALEAFKTNPLVAIQHDGDLSRIEDNTRLNSLVSHELMTVNEKFKSTYANRFKCFLFLGTNKPVKITDAKSGLIRRLIDVSPSGNKLNPREYKTIVKQVGFELGAIAYHCQEIYLSDPGKYDDYIPVAMLGASNDFYNFVIDSYHVFKKEDGTTLKAAWEMYKTYCDEAKVTFPYSQRIFKEELKNYFRDYKERFNNEDGSRVRSYYGGFRTEKFEERSSDDKEDQTKAPTIKFTSTKSIFDTECADCFAQYATSNETPFEKWDDVTIKLSELNTSRVHYVRVPENHIVIDFDITDDKGNKSFEKNLEEASKWPPTYAELSKSGAGIHLHYIYNGDVYRLSRVYDDYVEIKVFTGRSSLRRKLSKCNDLPISTISSGLPLKGENKMVNFEGVKSEKGLRTQIKRNLNKEIHPATKPSIDFIYKILEDAFSSDLKYDITDMRNAVLAFAASSTHQADYCIKLVNKMQFKSADPSTGGKNEDAKLVFYDVEVFPNLFLCNWKIEGEGKPVVRMINPSPTEIEDLMRFRLVGFNCRRYDNHILYARLMGYDNEQLYKLSMKIIDGSPNCFFGEAYNVSYTDVYDFSSKKQSLKKFEIELGIHHQELGIPWDQPVPEELWTKVAEYCDNDVIATEATFNARKSDFLARQILADVAGMAVNDTTNTLTTKIIFGSNRKPHDQFNYRDMGSKPKHDWVYRGELDCDPEFTVFEGDKPIFPGYKFENGKSTYRGEEVGEGGYVYSEPGMYGNVALLDVASMHPSSIVAEKLFGEEYTQRFKDILDARMAIKHKDFDKARKMLGGALAKYLTDENAASDLATALKIAINSVYGLTSASFDNPFRDNRNKDNIVAKRGALFMINLKHEVQKRGFIVAHVKTDSIKIPDATPEIIQFVTDYGKQYGYTFEHEATYDRFCLVNDAVYIAKYKDGKHAGEWTATGTQFQIPYVFKKLFSREKIIFENMCETKAVTSALYLDMNESLPDVSTYEKERDDIWERLISTEQLSDSEVNSMEARLVELRELIEKGHNYRFIGKVGQFCPMKEGAGGGILLRETTNKKTGEKSYASATGSKGYRWLESSMVRKLEKESDIDRSYYDKMVDEAVKSISKYGDFEWFVSDEPYISKNFSWNMPCGKFDCQGCVHWEKTWVVDEKLMCDAGYECMPF